MYRRACCLCFVLLAALTGCGHSSSSSGATNLSFIGLPTALSVTPSVLSFTDTGSAYKQTVTVGAANFTTVNTCSGVAAVASSSATTFTVTPVAAGTCTITASADSAAGTVFVTVTQTTVGGN